MARQSYQLLIKRSALLWLTDLKFPAQHLDRSFYPANEFFYSPWLFFPFPSVPWKTKFKFLNPRKVANSRLKWILCLRVRVVSSVIPSKKSSHLQTKTCFVGWIPKLSFVSNKCIISNIFFRHPGLSQCNCKVKVFLLQIRVSTDQVNTWSPSWGNNLWNFLLILLSKSSNSSACPKCSANLKQYGKPSACSLCSINAAFKTDKCYRFVNSWKTFRLKLDLNILFACRCTSSEYKFGPAVKCEICQQMCAFNREDHRVDGKLHCWLCKLSYKRALAKAKKSDSDKQRHKKRSADEASLKANAGQKMGSSNNRSSGNNHSQRPELSKVNLSEIPEKIPKTANSGMVPSNSDHVVAITQLREQIATLQKKLQQKDGQLLQKDKEVSYFLFFPNLLWTPTVEHLRVSPIESLWYPLVHDYDDDDDDGSDD